MWELWEAPGGRRHLVMSGRAMCVNWWPNAGWFRVPAGPISCGRCAKRYGWRTVTADGQLSHLLEHEAREGEGNQ